MKTQQEKVVEEPRALGSLMLFVGPPAPDDPARELWDDYQQWCRREGHSGLVEGHPWQQRERELLEAILDSGEWEDGSLEGLIAREDGPVARLARYTAGFTRHGKDFVAYVSIDHGDLETLPRKVLLWPPDPATEKAIASVVGVALRREWVRTARLGEPCLCPAAPSPEGGDGERFVGPDPLIQIDPHRFFEVLLREKDVVEAYLESSRIELEALDALWDSGEASDYQGSFSSWDSPRVGSILETLGGSARCVLAFEYASGGPMSSFGWYCVASDVCGYDLLYSYFDDWPVGNLLAVRPHSDREDDGQLLAGILNSVEAFGLGFPPSAIENPDPDLITRDDLALAVYEYLDDRDAWSEFESSLALDAVHGPLKPPAVLFGGSEAARSAVEKLRSQLSDGLGDEEIDEYGEMSDRMKRALVSIYFGHKRWYREY
jgi:hypothetical protein